MSNSWYRVAFPRWKQKPKKLSFEDQIFRFINSTTREGSGNPLFLDA
jgi:hypothetical protein